MRNIQPLPALPSPQQPPHFEYMFSDAGLKKKKSNETMKSSTETDLNSEGEFQMLLHLRNFN